MTPVAIDHDARRASLAGVVADIAADEGLEAVTVRAVASAAGVSVGTVQHYFGTKDAMMLHAYEHVSSAVAARVEAAVADARAPREAVRAILLAMLPTDAESRRIIKVSVAFETRALHSPELAARTRADNAELQAAFEELFRLGGAKEPRREAIGAIALIGLCQPLLLDDPICRFDDAVDVIDAHLDRVLPTS